LRQDIIDNIYVLEKFREANISKQLIYKKTHKFTDFILRNFVLKCALKLYMVLLNANFLVNKYYLLHFIKRQGVLVNKDLNFVANFMLKP